jgi:NADP-dependent 3-hydroxy acid dehydrogenase YdfG
MSLTVGLSGRKILVTGASSGIGAATCRAVAGCGASVAMLARRKDRLDRLAGELGPGACPIQADVTDLQNLKAAVVQAAEALGGLDGVVTVAGRNITGTITTGTPKVWRQLVDVNLIGPLATTRYAVGHFPASGRRDIILIGSTGGVEAMPGLGIYGATKRGLRAAFESMRLELAPEGISVTLVTPGLFETDGTAGGLVVRDGITPPIEVPVFKHGFAPAPPETLAQAIAYTMSLPEGVSISEMLIRPTTQLHA